MIKESTGTKTGRKRYRYIFCGDVDPDDKIEDFRLIAGPSLRWTFGRYCIRVKFEEGDVLSKYSCDSYSKCWDDRKVRDFDPIVYDRCEHKKNEELTELWLAKKLMPDQFAEYLERKKIRRTMWNVS